MALFNLVVQRPGASVSRLIWQGYLLMLRSRSMYLDGDVSSIFLHQALKTSEPFMPPLGKQGHASAFTIVSPGALSVNTWNLMGWNCGLQGIVRTVQAYVAFLSTAEVKWYDLTRRLDLLVHAQVGQVFQLVAREQLPFMSFNIFQPREQLCIIIVWENGSCTWRGVAVTPRNHQHLSFYSA